MIERYLPAYAADGEKTGTGAPQEQKELPGKHFAGFLYDSGRRHTEIRIDEIGNLSAHESVIEGSRTIAEYPPTTRDLGAHAALSFMQMGFETRIDHEQQTADPQSGRKEIIFKITGTDVAARADRTMEISEAHLLQVLAGEKGGLMAFKPGKTKPAELALLMEDEQETAQQEISPTATIAFFRPRKAEAPQKGKSIKTPLVHSEQGALDFFSRINEAFETVPQTPEVQQLALGEFEQEVRDGLLTGDPYRLEIMKARIIAHARLGGKHLAFIDQHLPDWRLNGLAVLTERTAEYWRKRRKVDLLNPALAGFFIEHRPATDAPTPTETTLFTAPTAEKTEEELPNPLNLDTEKAKKIYGNFKKRLGWEFGKAEGIETITLMQSYLKNLVFFIANANDEQSLQDALTMISDLRTSDFSDKIRCIHSIADEDILDHTKYFPKTSNYSQMYPVSSVLNYLNKHVSEKKARIVEETVRKSIHGN